MPTCRKCGVSFPNRVKVDGVTQTIISTLKKGRRDRAKMLATSGGKCIPCGSHEHTSALLVRKNCHAAIRAGLIVLPTDGA